MNIAIRTDNEDTEITILSKDGKQIASERWRSGRELSNQLLARLTDMVERHNYDWPKIEGVIVFTGPGSFTGLRIGVTVANTIAYALDIPIIGTLGISWVEEGVVRLNKGENEIQVVPHYGSEPNISKPKR